MQFDTKTAASYAADKLDSFLARATRDSSEVAQQNDLSATVAHFAELRDLVDNLKAKTSALQKHVDSLSYETIPTQFLNANVKTINVVGVGRVTVNVRWSATVKKEVGMAKAMEWLRETGNSGLIIETISAPTLTAFAKAERLAGKSLPDSIFNVGTAPYTSITKSGVANDERMEP